MLKERREAAQKVADSLFTTEAAIDAALAQASVFVGTMPAARLEANLSAVVGQTAIEKAAEAVVALAAARSALIEAHNALFEVQGQIGLGAVNFGNFAKPAFAQRRAVIAQLRTVESAAA